MRIQSDIEAHNRRSSRFPTSGDPKSLTLRRPGSVGYARKDVAKELISGDSSCERGVILGSGAKREKVRPAQIIVERMFNIITNTTQREKIIHNCTVRYC
jgi:hypothetical protein